MVPAAVAVVDAVVVCVIAFRTKCIARNVIQTPRPLFLLIRIIDKHETRVALSPEMLDQSQRSVHEAVTLVKFS